ncbi:hypothetical protein LWI29_007765 [Acer saccharum]|uniref:Uncharacterized protein n=1 Tax=Acer saccharum TaxID=4024 RepID=A0AA39W0L4_ACESA|nr:hypothetical protein LWI29_007765 [Acer saccharum]
MPVHTLPIHDDGTFNFFPPTSSVPLETAPHEDTISSTASLNNEISPDTPPVSDSSPMSTSAQPIPPIRSVRSRQPPSYLKHYHCPTLPHVANLVQSDSKAQQYYTNPSYHDPVSSPAYVPVVIQPNSLPEPLLKKYNA